MDAAQQKAALSHSVADGVFGTVWTSLTGGAFLVGYALSVFHADSRLIGLLAALPLLANLVQVPGSLFIERTGRKKPLSILGVMSGRLAWIGVILLPVATAPLAAGRAAWPLVAVIGLSSLFAAVGSVGWTAWMGDLVPAKRRGAFFGRRNMIASVAGMAALVLGGRFLDAAVRAGIPDGTAFAALFSAGLLCGMVSVWFLSRLPETGAPPRARRETGASLFLGPLRDGNFRMLVLSVSLWTFSVQIAGPFYSVYLIDTLNVRFGTITLFGTCATVATLLMMRTWGPISDTQGNRPVVVVSSWILALVPVLWIVARPGSYFRPVLLATLVSGAAMAGAALSQFNILIKLSPREGRSMYIALFSAVTGLVGAAAPVVGGAAVRLLHGINLTVLSYPITDLQLLFLASSAFQVISILPALRIREPAARAPMAVILQLKNDLNPQTGIASSADFVAVEIGKGRRMLRDVDRRTERLAGASERTIAATADRIGEATAGVRRRLRRFLREGNDNRGQD